MSPVNDLLKGKKKGQSIKWNDQAEQAFCDIKSILVSKPVLTSADFSRSFQIQTAVSQVILGAVLIQVQDG